MLVSERTVSSRLSRLERYALILFAVIAVAFGAVVEFRSAFLMHRRTDLDVYLRAAWAVRTAQDPYKITDDHGWHYHYPPLFAIAMVPLADPPPKADRSWSIPFQVSVAVWYLLNLCFLATGVHFLASVVEPASAATASKCQRSPPESPVQSGSRRWWALRVIPIVTCIAPVGHTLMRGEVNLLLLALLCAWIIAMERDRRLRGGVWLAAAICLKVIPAFLLLLPLWRRNAKVVVGCFVGLIAGMLVIPAACFGIARTAAYYREWNQVLVQPALVGGTDQSRARELIDMTATDSQSFQSVLHNTLNYNRATRPAHATVVVHVIHWAVGALLTLATLLAAGPTKRSNVSTEVIFAGMLIVIMILLSPVCHLHYFSLAIPLVMGLMKSTWERDRALDSSNFLTWLLAAYLVATLIPHFPTMEPARDLGLAMYGALALWSAGLFVLLRESKTPKSKT
jgi:hypothetical protein